MTVSLFILAILWILWLATGALAAKGSSACADSGDELDGVGARACHEASALAAFAFLNSFIRAFPGSLLSIILMSGQAPSPTLPSLLPPAPIYQYLLLYTPGTGGTTQGSTGGPIGGQLAAYNTSESVQAGTVHV
ncbi:hypothetical protein B0H14DRAFT_2585162 [Mycena olivaceomarginata]|nr:hypothetical protein B0H14DRAFT_2585162 [Mycena olivaceomarginata]